MSADEDQKRGEPVNPRRNPFSGKEKHPEKDRLQEEGQNPLRRQKGPEDVAHDPGVIGPVRAERKLHREACRRADHEDQPEEPGAEIGDPPVDLVFLRQMEGLGDEDDQRCPQRHGGEKEMEAYGQRKLEPGKQYRVHKHPR